MPYCHFHFTIWWPAWCNFLLHNTSLIPSPIRSGDVAIEGAGIATRPARLRCRTVIGRPFPSPSRDRGLLSVPCLPWYPSLILAREPGMTHCGADDSDRSRLSYDTGSNAPHHQHHWLKVAKNWGYFLSMVSSCIKLSILKSPASSKS